MFGKKRKFLRSRIAGKPATGPRVIRSASMLRFKKPGKMGKIGGLFKKTLYLAVIVFLAYLVFFSSYPLVKEIYIAEENLDNIALGEEIEEAAKNYLGKNLIFLDTEELNAKILDHVPQLQSLNIEKGYPESLEISFTEFALAANVINEAPDLKKSYIINSAGYAAKEDLKSTNLPTIIIKSAEPPNTKSPIIEELKLNYILNAITYFEEKFGMKIKEILYKPQAREVHIITEKDFAIWLDIQKSAEDQLKKLKKALVKINIFNDPLLYIDLRIAGGNGDKIIYKRR